MAQSRTDRVLGTGWDFPYAADTGTLNMVVGTDSVDAAIRMVLSTRKGDRFMLPQYGSDIHSQLFQPADEETASMVMMYALEAIQEWIPRITNVRVRYKIIPDEHLIQLQIRYQYRNSPSSNMMIYPFYLQPSS